MERRLKEIEIFNLFDYPDEILLKDLLEQLQGLFQQVPDEYRDQVTVEIDRGTWDDSGARVRAYYERLETDEEIEQRRRFTENSQRLAGEQRRGLYLRLKKEFEPEAS